MSGWSSLHEAARRILRDDHSHLRGPMASADAIHALDLMISDAHPARIEPLRLLIATQAHVSIHDGSQIEVARLGGVAPEETVCWTPSEDMDATLKALLEAAERLLGAGYPGCIDCLGPAVDEPWDEAASRREQAGLGA